MPLGSRVTDDRDRAERAPGTCVPPPPPAGPLRELARKFVTFAGVGAIGTAAQYAILIALVQVLNMPALLATSLGFLAGALINYRLNYRYTFRSRKRHREALLKFMLVAAVGFCLNGALMALGEHVLHLYYLFSQVLATGAVLLWGFTGNHLWTFGKSHDQPPA